MFLACLDLIVCVYPCFLELFERVGYDGFPSVLSFAFVQDVSWSCLHVVFFIVIRLYTLRGGEE